MKPVNRICACRILALTLAANSLVPLAAEEVLFSRDVMAVLSKAGCNAGTCHGNASGKGGFKLSLRGQDPDLDFAALTRDQFARRIDPLNPDQSLLLLKPTAQLAHEGGKRFEPQSEEYRLLREWIAGGRQATPLSAPKLAKIEVTPAGQILVEPADRVQVRAYATFTDGTRRDVTSLAVYEPGNKLVKVSHDGLVERAGFGETTLLVRYLQEQRPVRIAFVPARPDFKWKRPAEHNYIDKHIFAKLRDLRMTPSDLCSDAVFLRRACLDLLGLLPTAEEARAFVADPSRKKRERLIDRLLERPEFADYWALKWSDLLRNEEHALDKKGVQNFHHWIRQGLAEGKPLDQFVRELISARGSSYSNPAANYYRANRDPIMRAEATAQVFLGTRLQCAKCHNHPFDRWTQDDYYDWAGLFARVQYKVLDNQRVIGTDKHEWNGEQIVFIARQGSVQNPRTGQPATPAFLGQSTPSFGEDQDHLEELAAWITRPDNPFFARSQVNRIWYHLLGRGLVDPIDDFRASNPPSHPELLEALSKDFVKHRFDLRHLIRLIMNSRTYQLSSEPNATNAGDTANFSHALVRRVDAEPLLDCQSQVAGVPLKFDGFPTGLRAVQLPGVSPRTRGGRRGNSNTFLDVFGKPPRLLATECERSCEPTMSQAFQMLSGPLVNELIASPDNRLTRLLASGKSSREMVEELYWTALTRPPKPKELEQTVACLSQAGADQRAALEDILWGLINAKEFLFRN